MSVLRLDPSPLLCVVGALLLSACPGKGAQNVDDDGGPVAGTTGEDPPPAQTDGATSASTGEEEDESSTGVSFITDPDGGGPNVECDLWAQDCPSGEKCMPWVNDGGASWNATRCAPLTNAPGQSGDPCEVEGNAGTGLDNCDIGTMCWAVDNETNEGVCVSLCEGSPDAPLCDDPDETCSITNDGVLPLCLPSCDPLLQDCAGDGLGCYWLPGDGGFVCVQDVSGELGAPGDSCGTFTLNLCDPGTQCLPADAVPGCTGSASCCSTFCDLEDPDPGCIDTQECTALFEDGEGPPGTEAFGVCAIPAT